MVQGKTKRYSSKIYLKQVPKNDPKEKKGTN